MGLREAKKLRARAAIIANAVSLFRETSFESATIREICSRCDLSEATFFNYFPTKGSVLNAWAHGLVEEHFERVAATSERGMRPALRALCSDLARAIEDDADFAACAWARATAWSGVPSPVERLIDAGQAAGQLRRDLSSRQMGGILYGSVCGTIADWLERTPPRGPLVAELRRAVDLVLDGSRRRNERVRPTTGPGQVPPLSTR
jgi:AcrR family transcriptional regulator